MTRQPRGTTMIIVLMLSMLFFLFLATALEVQTALHRRNQAAKAQLQARAQELVLRVIPPR